MSTRILIGALTAFLSTQAFASLITIEEFGLSVNSASLQDVQFDRYSPSNEFEFDASGWTVATDNFFSSDNLGSFKWTVTNTGLSATNLTAIVFLDASIDEAINTYYNESAHYIGSATATSWEADEPGWVFGDIYDNVMAGVLDNQNSVGAGLEDDVSLALGFTLNEFNVGDIFEVLFTISTDNIGGFYQFDADSNFGFYFNANLNYIPSSAVVSEPAALALLGLGLFGLLAARKRKNINDFSA